MFLPPLPRKFIRRDERTEEKTIARNITIIMRDFGYTYDELMAMPIPCFFEVTKIVVEMQKEADKKSKGKHGKRKH